MGTRGCGHICNESTPGIGEAGITGEWRNQVPVINHEKCLPAKLNRAICFVCWLYCPEAVIQKRIPIEIDLAYCKGCGICAEECASGAITMVAEAEAGPG